MAINQDSNIIMLPIGQLYPHPDNPRKELGDLTELTDSIRECGVYQNLTVVRGHRMSVEEWKTLSDAYEKSPNENIRAQMNSMYSMDGYTVIIGHRRLAAAKLAGAEALPCSVVEMDEQTQFRTMLIENMQREDLTVYEQAQGFQMMMDFGDTEAGIAKKTGFSKKTVRKRLEIARLDQKKLKEITEDPERQITMMDLDKLSKIDNIDDRNDLLQKIGTNDFDFAVTNAVRAQIIDKGLEIIGPTLRASKCKKLERNDIWGSKYTKVKTVCLENPNEIKLDSLLPDTKGKKIFYCTEQWSSTIAFYVESEKPKPEKKSKAQIAREKRIADAHAELKALTATCYELRHEFIRYLPGTKEMMPKLMRGALLIGATTHISSLYGGEKKVLYALGLPTEYRPTKYQEAVDTIFDEELVQVHDFPRLIYAMLADKPDNGYFGGWEKAFPEHVKNEKLDAIYRFLCSLGYEMSEEEQKLQDGSHRLFHLDDKEEAAEE